MSSSEEIVVVSTGTANIASVRAALRRVGASVRVARDVEDVRRATRLVLPGVGTYAAGMASLQAQGLVGVLRARVAAGRPTLAICLGMQLLGLGSDEAPGVDGLRVVPVQTKRFEPGTPAPLLAWNRYEVDAGADVLRDAWAYFAHSYRVTEAPPGWRVAWAQHGGRYVAAFERGAVLACQFHPELSGADGEALLARWVRVGDRATRLVNEGAS